MLDKEAEEEAEEEDKRSSKASNAASSAHGVEADGRLRPNPLTPAFDGGQSNGMFLMVRNLKLG